MVTVAMTDVMVTVVMTGETVTVATGGMTEMLVTVTTEIDIETTGQFLLQNILVKISLEGQLSIGNHFCWDKTVLNLLQKYYFIFKCKL